MVRERSRTIGKRIMAYPFRKNSFVWWFVQPISSIALLMTALSHEYRVARALRMEHGTHDASSRPGPDQHPRVRKPHSRARWPVTQPQRRVGLAKSPSQLAARRIPSRRWQDGWAEGDAASQKRPMSVASTQASGSAVYIILGILHARA
jgi:hypothetical protein